MSVVKRSGIYAISLKADSSRFYIGSAVSFLARWRNHQSCLRRGNHHSQPLQRAWDKYGEDAFEFLIVEFVDDKSNLISREQAWLDRFSPRYNPCRVAGSTLGRKHSEETRQKMRGPKSEAHKRKLSLAAMGNKRCVGRVMSAEQKKKLSALMKWRKFSPESLAKWRSRVHPPEVRAKIAEANRRRTHSPETKAKMAEARRKYYENKRMAESL